MSFQNFRLDSISVQSPQSPPYPTSAPTSASTSNNIHDAATRGAQRGPYGSGDMDDGYTLVFENLEAFQAWREKEEEEKVVEFVKGDTHGSKAMPPRFKDHVKLICARHSRSGRKKYVKKYPERVRKVPSRKLDGNGCQASMSYKTYFDTPQVRVCYVSQHSHETGLANLPFTRRGRRAQAAAKSTPADPNPSGSQASQSHPGAPSPPRDLTAGQVAAPLRAAQPEPTPAFSSPYPHFPSMSMPLPHGLGSILPLPFPMPSANQAVVGSDRERMERERWDRLDVLYQSIRSNARQFEYPAASVAALESVLVRMYFESPIPAPAPPHPQPHPPYTTTGTLPMPQVPVVAPPQQPENIAMAHGDHSDDTSDGDEDDEEA
ncbi:hypothetical protein F5148DRAFT_1162566 [Russula earlei]|uniref:Uncharacterized protein n=1 Tax=Russula earlei TaxID=71964 RepID=A0ACC0ULW5_9AGAM|nr:hypothetical protein F5148DRAFT_1162566 [Russula earlei]